MILFFLGAFFGGAVGVITLALVASSSQENFYPTDSDLDPWEEEEFWDDYHRNI